MRRLVPLCCTLCFLAFACDNSTDDTTPDTTTDIQAGDTATDAAATDVTAADTADEEVAPHVVGCVGEFCAADESHAPDPADWGPFPVGVKTFSTSLKDYKGKWREVVFDVYYPAAEAHRDGPFEDVDLVELAPESTKAVMPAAEIPPIPTRQVRDAAVRTLDAPYPLVIFSHGAFGVRFQSVFFTQYLASHGYIVVSPDHTGNTLYDMIEAGGYSLDPVIESAWNRPLDVTRLIDLMLEWNQAPGSEFVDTILPGRIGISGHSFGGYTSVVQGFDDPRIKVALPMCPATQQLVVLGYELSEFPIPVMIMAGGLDNTLDTEKDMTQAYQQMPEPKYYFELKTAGHYSFTDICSLDLLALADDIGFGDAEDALEDGCGPENIPVETAHPLIRQFGIGFLNYHLRNSPESKTYFAAEAAAPHEEILIYELAE